MHVGSECRGLDAAGSGARTRPQVVATPVNAELLVARPPDGDSAAPLWPELERSTGARLTGGLSPDFGSEGG
jgi:hypothetical protein